MAAKAKWNPCEGFQSAFFGEPRPLPTLLVPCVLPSMQSGPVGLQCMANSLVAWHGCCRQAFYAGVVTQVNNTYASRPCWSSSAVLMALASSPRRPLHGCQSAPFVDIIRGKPRESLHTIMSIAPSSFYCTWGCDDAAALALLNGASL